VQILPCEAGDDGAEGEFAEAEKEGEDIGENHGVCWMGWRMRFLEWAELYRYSIIECYGWKRICYLIDIKSGKERKQSNLYISLSNTHHTVIIITSTTNKQQFRPKPQTHVASRDAHVYIFLFPVRHPIYDFTQPSHDPETKVLAL
jgi:hypothetical protein